MGTVSPVSVRQSSFGVLSDREGGWWLGVEVAGEGMAELGGEGATVVNAKLDRQSGGIQAGGGLQEGCVRVGRGADAVACNCSQDGGQESGGPPPER